jgi:hypothetical protein
MVERSAGGLVLLLGDLCLERGDGGGGDTMVLEDVLLPDSVPVLGW